MTKFEKICQENFGLTLLLISVIGAIIFLVIVFTLPNTSPENQMVKEQINSILPWLFNHLVGNW